MGRWHAPLVDLGAELAAAAAAGAPYGQVTGVLAAEPAIGRRAYLLAIGEDEQRRWLVLGEGLEPLRERTRVSEVASIVVLCELALELAAEPRAPDEADLAAELERELGGAPRVASPDTLDRIGATARGLERARGDERSALAGALAAHADVVEAFIAEVVDRHAVPLR